MVRSRVLGLAVGTTTVRAVLVERIAITWAGSADYSSLADLADVIARLAGESGKPVRRARVALERTAVQLRSIDPAPPIRERAVPAYVALETTRLFRTNGAPLVTDAVVVPIAKDRRALWAAAVPEPLLAAIVNGCDQAGLVIEALAPAADTLPAAIVSPDGTTELVFPNGCSTESLSVGIGGVWRSRLVRGVGALTGTWVPSLAALGTDAPALASAYATAVRLPTLELVPSGRKASQRQNAHRRQVRVAALGLALWMAAAGVFVLRLVLANSRTTHALDAARVSVDSALALRRDLDASQATLATIARARAFRSQRLRLLGELTRVLPDSVTLIALHTSGDGTVRLAGYAPRAAQVVAELGHIPGLSGVRLEGTVTRESLGAFGERDRFSIVAAVVRQ